MKGAKLPVASSKEHMHRMIVRSALVALVFLLLYFAVPDTVPSERHVDLPLPDIQQVVADALEQPRTPLLAAPDQASQTLPPPLVPVPPAPQTSMEYVVQKNDTLSMIFDEQGFGQEALHAVLAADEEVLALDVLRPGEQLYFEWEPEGEKRRLTLLSIHLNPGLQMHYRLVDDGTFAFEEIASPSQWDQEVVTAEIHGSFYNSAKKAGLDDWEIMETRRIFEEKINFRRDIRAGDRFELVLSREIAEAGATGKIRIDAARLLLGKKTYGAFLFDDGNYYDDSGESLSRAFLRYPTTGRYRVSSPFNLRRLHPVTRRVAPHHGTDFAMPVGTPVLTTGDGVVTRVGNHAYAGKYIEISHQGQFSTRYLHLSRILVKKGQRVQRGDRIALSGNTGRSTGAHLHFELRIRNRPVNAMTADIPTAARVPKKQMARFKATVGTLLAVLEGRDEQLKKETARLEQADSQSGASLN